jgi:hypothetical protein
MPDATAGHDDTLRHQLIAARVGLESGGCCPVEGPCDACDCFDPKHQLAKQEIDHLMPTILADRQQAVDEALEQAALSVQAARPALPERALEYAASLIRSHKHGGTP